MISKECIQDILLKSDIVEVISNFINLKKIGSNYRGLSPFSNESTPSLMVSPLKKIWKDFSSGKGGNVITFLMEYENISYPESLIWLANKYNISIIEYKKNKQNNSFFLSEKDIIYKIQDFGKNFFIKKINIINNLGKIYLEGRNICNDSIKKFEIGYANNNWNEFTTYALNKGFKLKILENSGLSIIKNNKNIDRFRNCIIFPIKNIFGKTLGFGSRFISLDHKFKYLNSPDSIIYKKGKNLYGIYESKKYIVKKNFCYLVEGYIDVISLHQIGIKNVVAILGTSITNDQILLIKKFTKNIIILYDGDQAGIKAAIKSIDLLLNNNLNIKIVTFNNSEDPDSFIQKNNIFKFKQFIKNNIKNFIKFKINIYLNNNKNDIQKKKKLIKSIIKSISIIKNNIDRELYIQETSRLINININSLYQELYYELNKKKYIINNKNIFNHNYIVNTDKKINKENINPILIAEKMIIKFILLYGDKIITINKEYYYNFHKKNIKNYKTTILEEIIKQFEVNNFHFSKFFYQKIFNYIKISFKSNIYNNINSILENFKNNNNFKKNNLHNLANWKLKKINVSSKEERLVEHFKEIILRYKSHYISNIINNLILRSKKDNKNNEKIIDRIIYLTKIKVEINKKLHRYV